MMLAQIAEVIPATHQTLAMSALSGLRDLSDQVDAARGWITLLALGGVVAAGLALWTLGGRFVRPSVVLVASATGGYIGFTLGDVIDPAIGPWIGLGVGVIGGSMLGYTLFRFASAALLAAFLAVAAPAGAAVALDYNLPHRAQRSSTPCATPRRNQTPRSPPMTGAIAALRSSLADQQRPPPAAAQDADESIAGGPPRAGAWITGFLADAAEGGEAIWDGMEPREQNTLILASAIGAIAGLLIGGIFPTLAMAVLTSGLGAGLMLGAGSHLAVALRRSGTANCRSHPSRGPRSGCRSRSWRAAAGGPASQARKPAAPTPRAEPRTLRMSTTRVSALSRRSPPTQNPRREAPSPPRRGSPAAPRRK